MPRGAGCGVLGVQCVPSARCRVSPKQRRGRIVVPATLLIVLLGAAADAQVVDRVLAVVDGRLVTLSDVRVSTSLGLVQASSPEQAADLWIERLLVLQEVDRFAPPEPSAAAVDARLAQIMNGGAATPAMLARLGIDEPWLRRWARDDLRIQGYIEQRFAGSLEPGPEEIENYFREHPAEFVRDGKPLGDAEAQALARERLMTTRRRTLVADWLDGLKRRAAVIRPPSQP